jgi:hypothetical protein
MLANPAMTKLGRTNVKKGTETHISGLCVQKVTNSLRSLDGSTYFHRIGYEVQARKAFIIDF